MSFIKSFAVDGEDITPLPFFILRRSGKFATLFFGNEKMLEFDSCHNAWFCGKRGIILKYNDTIVTHVTFNNLFSMKWLSVETEDDSGKDATSILVDTDVGHIYIIMWREKCDHKNQDLPSGCIYTANVYSENDVACIASRDF